MATECLMCEEASTLSSWSALSSRCLDCEETGVIKIRFLFRRNNTMSSIQVMRIKEMYGNNKENSHLELIKHLHPTSWWRNTSDRLASPSSTVSSKILHKEEFFDV